MTVPGRTLVSTRVQAISGSATCSRPSFLRRYVQGINDLATPFLAVFLRDALPHDFNLWDASLEQGSAALAEVDE